MGSRLSMIEAATRLGWTYQQTHNAVLQGRLEGSKDGTRWWVSLNSVKKLEREQQRPDAAA